MNYIETAFGHLAFAIKLLQAAEDGLLDAETIDRPLSVDEGMVLLILPDRVLGAPNDLIVACQNHITMAFGAAAITLNRCREEAGVRLPDPIRTASDQWISLVYQIRNAFAHDIAEPRWRIHRGRFARRYEIGPVTADLRGLHGTPFDYSHIGGAGALFHLKEVGDATAFGRASE